MSQCAEVVLLHAKWHCLWGSELSCRTPDQGDLDAAVVLEQLLESVVSDSISEECE